MHFGLLRLRAVHTNAYHMYGWDYNTSILHLHLPKQKKGGDRCYAVATARAGRVVANTRSQQQGDGDCLHSVSNTQNSC